MANSKQTRTHYIACNLCEAICGLEIKLEDGQIRSIKGDQQDPISKGHICPKAVVLQDIYNDPDRLRRPIKKTEDGWQPISWLLKVSRKLCGLKATMKIMKPIANAVWDRTQTSLTVSNINP